MIVELSKEDLEHIESWYHSASGESQTAGTAEMFDLLDRLGIQAAEMDLYPPNPEHWIESHKPVIHAQIAAIKAYRERHPEIELD